VVLIFNYLYLQKSTGSYSNLGITYKVPDGFDGKTFLAGSCTNWTIEEIETYQV